MINLNVHKQVVLAILLFCSCNTWLSAQCLSGFAVTTQDGATELRRCSRERSNPDIVRFSTASVPTPVAYLVTDEENNILLVSASNKIDLTTLGPGLFRIWSFSYAGQIQAEVGQNAAEANLGSISLGATSNC